MKSCVLNWSQVSISIPLAGDLPRSPSFLISDFSSHGSGGSTQVLRQQIHEQSGGVPSAARRHPPVVWGDGGCLGSRNAFQEVLRGIDVRFRPRPVTWKSSSPTTVRKGLSTALTMLNPPSAGAPRDLMRISIARLFATEALWSSTLPYALDPLRRSFDDVAWENMNGN